jgi:biotin transport system substrate-specific component
MSGLLLGARLGFLSQVLYLFMGLIGLPVFAGGGGIGYVVTGSFGYLVGFLFCALAGGFLADLADRQTDKVHISYIRILLISLAALLVCYTFGIVYLYFLSNYYTGFTGTKYSFLATLAFGTLPYIGKDVVLCLLASELTRRLWRFRYRKVIRDSSAGMSAAVE